MKKLIIPIVIIAGAYFLIPKFKELVNSLFAKAKTGLAPTSLPSSTVSTSVQNNTNNQN